MVPTDRLAQYGGEQVYKNLAQQGKVTPYEPETTAGRYAKTAAEYGAQAVAFPGSIARNAIAYGVVPGLASEAAGDAAKAVAPSYEPAARVAAGLAAGGGMAYALRPSAAERIATRSLTEMHPAERDAALQQAQDLLNEAQARGIPLSTANAIDAASGGRTGLSDLQRHVEATGRMKPFYAEMPAAVDQAGRAAFDTIAPVAPNPSSIGPALGHAAGDEVGAVQGAINQATRPAYQAAEQARVGPQIHQGLTSDPLYAQTLAEIRNNPALNRTIENMPDDAVGVIDLVQRRLRERGENAAVPGHADSGNLMAANLEDARRAPIAAAETATGGDAGAYAAARAAQAQLRQQYLEPLMAGPVGRMAEGDPTTRKAIEAFFPANPVANSQAEVVDALGRLSARNPYAARQLVRTHAESVFNEATQNLMGGPNQGGGAKFAAALRGNPQQAANLDAAIRVLPNGDVVADGFNRFLDVLEAGGRRQAVGSRTAYNAQELAQMGRGGPGEALAKMISTGGLKLPAKTLSTIEEWRQGRNLDRLATLFSDPDAVAAFRGLLNARDPIGPVARLVAIANRGANRERQ